MSNRPSRLRDKEKVSMGEYMKTSKGKKTLAISIAGAALAVFLIIGFLPGSYFGFSIAPPGPEPTEFGLVVSNQYDGAKLNTAMVSFFDSDANGDPDTLLATGTPDNSTMLNWPFLSGQKYWGFVQMTGFQSKWVVLDTKNNNEILMWKLLTQNATGVTFLNNGNGSVMTSSMKDTLATLTFFYNVTNGNQSGKGMEPSYDAMLGIYKYMTLNFTFNATLTPTDAVHKNFVAVSGLEITAEKVISGSTLSIPMVTSFMCGAVVGQNSIALVMDLNITKFFELTQIDLVYDGVLYGTLTI